MDSAATEKRQDNWEDLNYDERTDRLARLVTEMFRENMRLQDKIRQLENDMQTHQHDEKGNVYKKVGVGGDGYDVPRSIGQAYPSYPTTLRGGGYHSANPLNIKALSGNDEIEKAPY